MTAVITHSTVTGASADSTALVDGVAWDANHTITGTVSPSQGGTGVANGDSSTITISGAFGMTFTITATTSLTLPTTGTLATLAGVETLTNKTLTSPILDTGASLSSGFVLNWNSGDVLLTHASNALIATGFDDATSLVNVHALSGETDHFGSLIIRGSDPGTHNAEEHNLAVIEHRPVGSGTNGPEHADYALTVSALKSDFSTTSVVGEVDGVNIVVRNGGAGSDCSAILAEVGHYGTGASFVLEGVTQKVTAPSTVNQQVRVQAGVIDTVNTNYTGYYSEAEVGSLSDAFRADTEGSATWDYLFRGRKLSTDRFTVTGDGVVTSTISNALTNSPNLTLEQSSSGDCQIQWLLTATRAWIAGIDNSDSDKWKLAAQNDGFVTPSLAVDTSGNLQVLGAITPFTNDAAALGSATVSFSDLFLASGGVINFNNGDVAVTHSANQLAFTGASNGYTFDVPIAAASGGTGYAGGTWASFTSTATPGAGSITSQTSSSTYLQIGKIVLVSINITITNAGTGSGSLTVTLPVASVRNTFLPGRESGVGGLMLSAVLGAGSTNGSVFTYDNNNPTIATNAIYNFSGIYEAQ